MIPVTLPSPIYALADITAPGFALASSVSSFDTSYNTGGTNYSSIISADTVLQVNPNLSPAEAKNIINTTAITDRYTGGLPAAGVYVTRTPERVQPLQNMEYSLIGSIKGNTVIDRFYLRFRIRYA
jgi:hypothetical protein